MTPRDTQCLVYWPLTSVAARPSPSPAGAFARVRLESALSPTPKASLLNRVKSFKPASMASVSSLLGMDRTTLTAAIKPLERRGLLTVATDPSDRRGRRLSLTGEGKTLLASALPVWERTHEKVTQSLEGGSADCLRRGLNAIS